MTSVKDSGKTAKKESKNEIRLVGLPLSKGCALGNVCLLNENRHSNLPMYKVQGSGIDHEMARVIRAIEIAGQKLDDIRTKVEKELGSPESEIFVAQKMIMEDPSLSKEIFAHIKQENTNAESAITHVLDSYESRIAALDDEYISARATDFGEIRRRLLDVMGHMRPSLQCDEINCQKGKNRIIVAEELTPSLTIDVKPDSTIAFLTEHGGINSHAAILARSLGIPAISGLPGLRDMLGCGTEILINGTTGEIVIWPTDETIAKARAEEPLTRGTPDPVDPVDNFKVMANISWAADIEDSLKMKAEGIGLYRTEFEIMAAERFLSEDELYERYIAVGKAMAGNVVIFRLFDMGSDKSLPFMGIPKEDNPSLGWRGARLLLGKKDILEVQARALARTSEGEGGRIHVMYPMIIDVEQFLEIKQVFMNAIQDIPYGEIKHGIMFEVPAACLQARELMNIVDFASIGTNDLTQYLFAVDRDNDLVSYDYNPDKPVFWNLIKDMASAAHDAGKPLSLCGELAGYSKYIPKLIEMGINAISVSPRRIPEVRTAAAHAQSRNNTNLDAPGEEEI
ncbi:MAG: phosphoenolpyruvate--protein phosphotransferase [Kiritimatiellae bacterium]|nr:phosphoenolpyruvate--protein phosphotransferase [Kiritimatiellia bacterium]